MTHPHQISYAAQNIQRKNYTLGTHFGRYDVVSTTGKRRVVAGLLNHGADVNSPAMR